jgi:hypothetical protein
MWRSYAVPITVAVRPKARPSSAPPALGSWVIIPLEAWMSVCVYFMFVLF